MTEGRIVDPGPLAGELAGWRAAGLRVALLAGDFDVLAPAHARAIGAARRQADRVVLAVREDAEVTRRRGAARPVLPATERARIAAALRGVDRVVVASPADLERLALEAGGSGDAELDLADPVERLRARAAGGAP